MLEFVGLGLYDAKSVTIEGQAAITQADVVFAEFYTSRLIGIDVAELEQAFGVSIQVRPREGVEGDPSPILDAAENAHVAFLTAGDPMISTTHVDLRLRAHGRGIQTRIIHGITAETAASSLTGLQNYRFGPSTTLPIPYSEASPRVPENVIDTLDENQERGLHTIVFLDIQADQERFMTADHGARLLASRYSQHLAVVVARAGSPEPLVTADRIEAIARQSFGEPLHMLVLPGDLHHIERDALVAFANAPPSIIDSR